MSGCMCEQRCPCHSGPVPPEPPLGTWMRDRHGGTCVRFIDTDGNDGWGQGPGFYACGKWEAMWHARGPYVECGPHGVDHLEAEQDKS
jgi:hypothetical protein